MSSAIREKLEAYFSSMNPTSNRMMADIISSREKYIGRWETMDPGEQSDILWKAIVKSEVIEKYRNIQSESSDVEFFPVLQTKPGEKIIVEEDTASAKSFVSGTVYHDEHSAPFRWETQSQIDFRLTDIETENENIRTLERDASKSPEREKQIPGSPKTVRETPKSPKPEKSISNSSKLEKVIMKSPKPEKDVSKSLKPEKDVLKSPKPERNCLKSSKTEKDVLKSSKSEREVLKSPKPDRHVSVSPKPPREVPKSPKPGRAVLKSPIVPERTISMSIRQEQSSMKCLTLNPNTLKSSKMDPKSKSQSNLARSPAEFSLCSPVIDIRGSLKSLGPESPRSNRRGLRKDDDVRRPIKRPEVPPPPVPPHFPPPVPPHASLPSLIQNTAKAEKSKETPIYAKVVKRKSANAKTLMLSEMGIHKKATEEMKPAIPPRMSLELKADMNLMKYTAHTIDIDGIPKTGFDFLDNW